MSVPFTKFRAIYPPHPALAWKPSEVHPLAGYAAQYKYNDWHTLIYFFPDDSIRFYTRKKTPFASYHPPHAMLAELRRLKLPKGQFHVLDGGLMHHRTERIRNTIVLWDVLVYGSEYLVGARLEERYGLLEKICDKPTETVLINQVPVALRISPHLWLAPLLRGDFKQLFERTSRVPELEGLVLKKLEAPLEHYVRQENNARWQIRVRKPAKAYSF